MLFSRIIRAAPRFSNQTRVTTNTTIISAVTHRQDDATLSDTRSITDARLKKVLNRRMTTTLTTRTLGRTDLRGQAGRLFRVLLQGTLTINGLTRDGLTLNIARHHSVSRRSRNVTTLEEGRRACPPVIAKAGPNLFIPGPVRTRRAGLVVVSLVWGIR